MNEQTSKKSSQPLSKPSIKQSLRIVLSQMTSVDNESENLSAILNCIQKHEARRGAHFDECASAGNLASLESLYCFPENCLYMRIKEKEVIAPIDLQGESFSKLKNVCERLKINIHLGSVPLFFKNKLANSSVFINSGGKIKVSYRKIHLFDIDLESGISARESDVFEHGEKPEIIEVGNWKIGQSICYDVRFAELYSVYAKAEVDLILIPSAFLVPTGRAHWETLIRARAIENQAFVVAAAQCGEHKSQKGSKRNTFGHSMVVSPWGEVLYMGSQDTPESFELLLDPELIDRARRQIPMLKHRRI